MTREELIEVMARAVCDTPAECIPEGDCPFCLALDYNIRKATTVLAAIEASGHAIVPVEHTDEMAKAFWKDGRYFATSYSAMIKAGRI